MALTESTIGLGRETTYGTKSTALDRGYEGQADSWARMQEPLVSQGFRPGLETEPGDRRTEINMGGEGSIEFDVLTQGFGRIMWGLLGSTVGTVAAGGTGLLATTTSEVDAAGNPFTVQVVRISVDDTARVFDHLGSIITGWGLDCETDGHCVFSGEFDSQNVVTAGAQDALTYEGSPFTWAECVVNIDGTDRDLSSFSFEADLGYKTDRRFLRGSPLKKQPVRTTRPTYQGEFAMEFEDFSLYDLWVAGTAFPIVATWTGAEYEAGQPYLLRLSIDAARFTGSPPEAQLDDTPQHTLPWTAVDDLGGNVVTLEYRSDSAAVT